MNKKSKKATTETSERPPIVVVMGHIDHGKSTLLDTIRKSNTVEGEAGGITQHLSAYEIEHTDKNGKTHRITFLDTPGHEAFGAMRIRGAKAADVAILVVAADDGVNTQTKEAYEAIKESNIPFVVVINKIDKPNADVNRTISSLTENEIYLEGYGGDIPYAEVSAKNGDGIDDLLDIVLLVTELEDLKMDPLTPAQGFVLESHVDPQRGIGATLVITDGTIHQGEYIVAGNTSAPVRMIEDHAGQTIKEAWASSPIGITGFDEGPHVGDRFYTFPNKKEALAHITPAVETTKPSTAEDEEGITVIPLIIKTDVQGMRDALMHEIEKVQHESVHIRVIQKGVGDITENDVRTAESIPHSVVIGFHVEVPASVSALADRVGVEIKTFTVIYDLVEWLDKHMDTSAPIIETREVVGRAKVLKYFSAKKDKQIIGGKVTEGELETGLTCSIIRRGEEIDTGTILVLQSQRADVPSVKEGTEFGCQIQSRTTIAEGDELEVFVMTQK